MSAQYLIRVLGPIDIVTEHGAQHVGGLRQRTLLAALVLATEHAVPTDHLVDVIWGDDPPRTALTTLQSYVSRLRGIIGPDRVLRRNHGYALVAHPDEIDALRFERLATSAIDAKGDPVNCRRCCQEALGLWRGVPFGDLADVFPFRLEAIRLEEIRHGTMELRFETDLALGHHDLVVGAIESAVDEYPYRERLWYLLIEALKLQGRRVEALRVCQSFRNTLGNAGMEPGPELTAIEDELAAGPASQRA